MVWQCVFVYVLMGFAVFSVSSDCTLSRGQCRDRTISANGTVNLAVIASMHEPYAGKFCGDISTQGFQTSLAIEWIMGYLDDYIPGISLGFDIYDDCGVPSRATDAILDIIPNGKPTDLLTCDNTTRDPILTGIIGMTSLEACMSISKLIEPETAFISGHARSPTLEIENNILFTIPSVKEEVRAAIELLWSLQWYYVQIVHTDEAIGKLLLEEFKLQQKSRKICYGGIQEISIQHSANVDEVKTNVKELIDYLEIQQSHARNEKMGVVYLGGTSVARYLIESIIDQKSDQARNLQWIMLSNIISDVDIIADIEDSNTSEDNDAKTLDIFLLTVSHHGFVDLTTFKDYFIGRLQSGDPENKYTPWFDKYMAKVYPSCGPTRSCTPQQLDAGYRQDINSVSAVVAVLALASALKKVHSDKCGNISGLCSALPKDNLHALVANELRTTSISLTEDATYLPSELRKLNTSIDIVDNHFHINGFAMVTYFTYDTVHQQEVTFVKIGDSDTGISVVVEQSSICKDTCDTCPQDNEVQFAYVHGDVIILGLFSIRESLGNFGCDAYRNDDYSIITALAFIQTIKTLAPIGGKVIGALAFDDCYSSLNTSFFLAELFSGKKNVYDPVTGARIDMSKVRVVVGALSSDVTLSVVEILTRLNIPMVSYGASSAFLDNRRMYPYFLRTVPSDKLQANGIVDLLRTLNFSFVGAIYIDDAYGYNGLLDVEERTSKNGICIIDKLMVTDSFKSYDVIERKLEENVVEVVVFYGIDTVAKEMMQSFEKSYIYIASEAWGTNPDLITNQNGLKNRGSLVFQTDTSYHSSDSLHKYLTTLTPKSDTGVPWIERFWENLEECDFPWSTNKRFTNGPECSMDANIDENLAERLSDQQRVVHASHAVNAIWKACSESELCMTSSMDDAYAKDLSEAIKQVKLDTVEGVPFRLFNDDGNGYMGLSIYNIQQTLDRTYSYIKVGTYSENGIAISLSNVKFYDAAGRVIKAADVAATCKPSLCRTVCQISPPVNDTTLPPSTDKTPTPLPPVVDDSLNIVSIVMGVIMGCMFIVMILLVVLLFRQHTSGKEKISHQRASMQSHTASIRSLDDMYEEVGSSRGAIKPGFEFQPSSSSGFKDGSSGSGCSIKYSDVVQSLPDFAKPPIPATAASSASGSGGDSSSVPSRGSRVTDKHNSGISDGSAHSSLGDHRHMTYMTAKDLDLVDEDVMAPHANYLDLKGVNDPNPYAAQDSTLQRKQQHGRNPDFPVQSQENMPLPVNSAVFYRPSRPETLPGINAYRVPNSQTAIPSTNSVYLQNHQNLHPPSTDLQQAMYLHAIGQDHIPLVSSAHLSHPADTHPVASYPIFSSSGKSPNQNYLLANGLNNEPIMYIDPVRSAPNERLVNTHGDVSQSTPIIFYDSNGIPHIYTDGYLPRNTNDFPMNFVAQPGQSRPMSNMAESNCPSLHPRVGQVANTVERRLQENAPVSSASQNNDPRLQNHIPVVLSPVSGVHRPVARVSNMSSGSGSHLSPSQISDDDGEVIII